jgi:endonuclease/exonuclease/phosphatase family metal-dependent hydrolase
MRLLSAIVATCLLSLALAADARPTATPLTLLQLNMCGNACTSGGLDVVDELVRTVAERRPFAVTLNEVCENQFGQLRADLAGYHGQFDPTGPKCRNGERYGNAAFLRTAELTVVGSWQLPALIFEEDRRLLCVAGPPLGPGPVIVCVTHLSVDRSNLPGQIDAVATVLSGLTGPLVLAGDFNSDPADARMDSLYQRFHEVDAGDRGVLNQPVGSDVLNEDTYDRHKFDYIFLSDDGWSTSGADAADAVNGRSDHDGLWATVTLHPTRPAHSARS